MYTQKLNFLLLCKPQAKVILVVENDDYYTLDAETVQISGAQALRES